MASFCFNHFDTDWRKVAAMDDLNTNDAGTPSTYDDARIREVTGLLLGYPQFMEQ